MLGQAVNFFRIPSGYVCKLICGVGKRRGNFVQKWHWLKRRLYTECWIEARHCGRYSKSYLKNCMLNIMKFYDSTFVSKLNFVPGCNFDIMEGIPFFYHVLHIKHGYIYIIFLLATIAESDPANVIFGKSRRFWWNSWRLLFLSSHYFLCPIWIYNDIFYFWNWKNWNAAVFVRGCMNLLRMIPTK